MSTTCAVVCKTSCYATTDRGRKDDPLYKIPLNARGADRMVLGLRLGDPNDEVLGAQLAG